MPSNSAASMFGGAGGRGARASVASLEGLRNVMRNDTETDSAPATPVAPAKPAAPATPVAPADDKQTLRGLNDRLSGYLGRVKQLERENKDLQDQIDEILAKRKTPAARDWNEVEKPLEELKKKIKDIAMDNAKLLLQIDNTKLANDDFKNKLNDEKMGRKVIEKDLEDMKKSIEDTKLSRKQTHKEIDLVKEELVRLNQEHKDEVDDLRDKIKDSEVNVEIDSQNSNQAEILDKVRSEYDKLAKKNLKETEDWYKTKFENIKVEVAQKSEVLQSGKSELQDLIKQKQFLEIKIQTLHSMISNLEETMRMTKVEYGQRLAPLNKMILNLEADLREVRSQVEQQVDVNQDLLCVKMKLEAEINNYQQLMPAMTNDGDSVLILFFPDSSEFSLEDGLHSDQQKPEKVPNQQEKVKEEALVKQESAPSNKSTPPEAPAADKELIKVETAAVNNEADPVKPSSNPAKKKKPKTKTKKDDYQ
ncbi:keratin, type I cytoskeletal 18-like [Scomber scombrus]|uniref:keratin, type I cytoskeletal 18-like n=1 Tax=Scomber scombrus TaxID=13677 RepID=UPI002DD7E266|nr:keratin, type I cytoskeletal 18-like [Scomber scombrus]